tara:strand:+ start:189 stop:503 length:315 start_codon:yes stop_codon:yes gene_type:complete
MLKSDVIYPSLDEIICAVCKTNDVEVHELLSTRREQRIVNARFIYYLLAKECTRNSYPQIGRALCKDHTTVMAGYKKAKAKLGNINWLQQLRKTTELLALPLVA